MSILDDAIREHLELKRAHGADEAELKRLEDEAFGPPQRPDEPGGYEEAPTEFLGAAEGAAETSPEEAPAGRREANVADLQEAPPAAEEAPEEPEAEVIAEPPPEPETGAEPEAAEAPHSTEEREAIAEHPTELFDVESEVAEPEPSHPEPAEAPEEPAVDHGEDDFFSEQRLSEELDQALEAPLSDEPASSRGEDPIPPGPHTEEAEAHYAEREEEGGEGEDPVAPDYEPESADHEDVLEDTPDFLEDAPEADDAWFEQRPPKDFDFDD